MKPQNCKNLNELMTLWKNKNAVSTTYTHDKQSHNLLIDHKKNFFIADGIVDEKSWYLIPHNKRILFILKEAYEKNHSNEGWSLNERLKEYGPWGRIWNRVCEWTYGITYSSANEIAKYQNVSSMHTNAIIRKISVMNIKKSDGKEKSIYEEITAYAKSDANEIIKEIELIDPYIIICGATFSDINQISGNTIKQIQNDNWFYYSNAIGNKERLFIDYYHPANRYPPLLNYYGITNIYQQALKSQK